jgi:hypothetical protein
MTKNKIIILLCILFLTGCETLLNLNNLSSNRSALDQYVERQVNLFNKLKNDYLNGHLKQGVSKEAIIARYGEPIFCYADKNPEIKEYCSYRHPTNYFNSDIIDLKFDKKNKLVVWDLKPAEIK